MKEQIRSLSLTAMILALVGFLFFILILVFQTPLAKIAYPITDECRLFIIPACYAVNFLLFTVLIIIMFFRLRKPSTRIGFETAFIIIACAASFLTIIIRTIQTRILGSAGSDILLKFSKINQFCWYDSYLSSLAIYISVFVCGMVIACRRRKSFNFSLAGVILLAVSCIAIVTIIIFQRQLSDLFYFAEIYESDASLVIPYDICISTAVEIILAVILLAAGKRKTAAVLVPFIILAVFSFSVSPAISRIATNIFFAQGADVLAKYSSISNLCFYASIIGDVGMYLALAGAGKKLAEIQLRGQSGARSLTRI